MNKLFGIFVLLLTFTLSGCGGSVMTVSGEGPGTLGLVRLGTAIQDAKKKTLCTEGVREERRSAQVSTRPSDQQYYPPRTEMQVSAQSEFVCK